MSQLISLISFPPIFKKTWELLRDRFWQSLQENLAVKKIAGYLFVPLVSGMQWLLQNIFPGWALLPATRFSQRVFGVGQNSLYETAILVVFLFCFSLYILIFCSGYLTKALILLISRFFEEIFFPPVYLISFFFFF